MKRERATYLLEDLLERAVSDVWPACLVRSVYVFGSYMRGAVEPGDVDVAVDIDGDDRWRRHFVSSVTRGGDPYLVVRQALRGRQRGISFVFERQHGHDEIPMMLIWERGESIDTARDRLASIPVDPEAGRAPRDAMLPCFDGIDSHLPRFVRESFVKLVNDGTLAVQQVTLPDARVSDPAIRCIIDVRWKPDSPLLRAADAVLAYLESRRIDLHAVHLHGQDIDNSETPYFAGFKLRYLGTLVRCFAEFGGVEWIEIPNPTRTKPVVALHIRLQNGANIVKHNNSYSALF